jgi:hypothetical protein
MFQNRAQSGASVCCSLASQPDKAQCLPHFIIAGFQKSGTTVLSSLLNDIPLFTFAKRKELHFFSKDVDYSLGLEHYLSQFPYWDKFQEHLPNIYAESTPFYIASPDGCRRIAESIPGVKLIILLREPVERAYSEWQMKKRRVAMQEIFIEEISRDRLLYTCLFSSPESPNSWKSCVPKSVQKMEYWSKFLEKIISRAKKHASGWIGMLRECFVPKKSPHFGLRNEFGNSCSVSNLSLAGRETRDDVSSLMSRAHDQKTKYFDALSCFSTHYRMEKIKPLNDVFRAEMNLFRRCAGADSNGNLNVSARRLHEIVKACINVTLGISEQYIYRSLYAPQLYDCFQYIPKERIMLLETEFLDKNIRGALSAVIQFLLPELTPQTILDPLFQRLGDFNDTISQNYIEKHFPNFESQTGWKLRSAYPQMPSRIAKQARDFFKGPNEALFELIGERYWSKAFR